MFTMGNQNGKLEGKGSLEGRDVRLDQRVSIQLAKGVKYNMKILIRGEVSFLALDASHPLGILTFISSINLLRDDW